MRVLTGIVALALGAASAQAQTYHAIWGSAPDDIWAVADNGIAVHFDGTEWSSMRTGTEHGLLAVWGSGPRDVWAVGEGGAIMHWNGSAWAVTPAPGRSNLIAVAGCSAVDAYAITQSDDERMPPTLLRWNGSLWTKQTASVGFRVAGLAAACPEILVAGAAYFDPRPDERRMTGVLMRGRAGTWTVSGWNGRTVTDPAIGAWSWSGVAAGGGTSVLLGRNQERFQLMMSARAGAWRPVQYAQLDDNEGLDEVRYAVGGDGVVLAVSRSGFARWRNGGWAAVRAGRAPGLMFGPGSSVWALSGNDFYVLGGTGTVHHVTGDRGEVVYSPSAAPAPGAAPAVTNAAPAPGVVRTPLIAPVKRKP